MRRSIRSIVTAFFLLFVVAASASAELINLDFNGAKNSPGGPTATGAAVIGGAGDAWNGLPGSPGSASGLLNSTGAATAASVSWGSSGSWDGGGSPSPNPALTQDYLYQLGSGGTVDLSGLAAGGHYSVYLYTQNNDDNNRQTDFTINGIAQHSGVGSVGANAWTQGVNYTYYYAVLATGGLIHIDFASDPNHQGEAELNGLQILQVPEPASFVLFAIGAVGLFLVVRRRQSTRQKLQLARATG